MPDDLPIAVSVVPPHETEAMAERAVSETFGCDCYFMTIVTATVSEVYT